MRLSCKNAWMTDILHGWMNQEEFQIVTDKGYDYLQSEEDHHDFGLEYHDSAE